MESKYPSIQSAYFCLPISRTPTLLSDQGGRVFGVLVGHPTAPDWPSIVGAFNQAFRDAALGDQLDMGPQDSFSAIHTGVSYGLEQTVSLTPSTLFVSHLSPPGPVSTSTYHSPAARCRYPENQSGIPAHCWVSKLWIKSELRVLPIYLTT